MTTETIASARGILATADRWLESLEAQLAKAQVEIDAANTKRGELAAELSELQHSLANATATHQSECDARKREISNFENAVIIREREAKAALERAAARELAAERRSLDLNQRIHSVGTI